MMKSPMPQINKNFLLLFYKKAELACYFTLTQSKIHRQPA
jgi:hypothetical protein